MIVFADIQPPAAQYSGIANCSADVVPAAEANLAIPAAIPFHRGILSIVQLSVSAQQAA